MRKTILIIGIVIALVITGVTTVQAAASTAELKVSAEKVKPGDTFTVKLHFDCEDGINAIMGKEADDGFKINYDSNKLELTNKEAKIVTDANEGTDTICLVYMGNNTVTTGDVYELTFKVKDSAELGTTEISTTELIVESLAATDSDTEVGVKTATVEIATETTPSDGDNQTDPDDQTNPDTTPSNTDGNSNNNSNSNSNSKTINGKTDPTTTSKVIPKTGIVRTFIVMGFVALAVTTFVLYRKMNGFRDIR